MSEYSPYYQFRFSRAFNVIILYPLKYLPALISYGVSEPLFVCWVSHAAYSSCPHSSCTLVFAFFSMSSYSFDHPVYSLCFKLFHVQIHLKNVSLKVLGNSVVKLAFQTLLCKLFQDFLTKTYYTSPYCIHHGIFFSPFDLFEVYNFSIGISQGLATPINICQAELESVNMSTVTQAIK